MVALFQRVAQIDRQHLAARPALVAAIGRLSGVPSLVSGPVTIVAALGVTHWLAKGMVADGFPSCALLKKVLAN